MTKQQRVLALLALFMLMLAACTPAVPPAQAIPTVPAVAETTAMPAPTTVPPTSAPAAATQSEPADTLVITDALGREVTFASPPQRVAFVGRAFQLVADAAYMFPDAVDKVAILGKSGQTGFNFLEVVDTNLAEKAMFANELSAEQLLGAKPDAVVLKSYLRETIGSPLEAAGVPVIYIDLETPEQYIRDITMLGQLFANPVRAEEINAFYKEMHDAVTSKTKDLKEEDKPKVLLLYYSVKDGVTAFNVPPMSWIQTIVTEEAGGIPVWKDANLGKGWTVVSMEQVAAWDPDQIYLISYSKPIGEVTDEVKADPTWQSLRAVKDGQIYGFPVDALSWDQADPRWILGLNWLAGKMHPDLFPEASAMDAFRTFYKEMYGLTDNDIDAKVLPHLQGDIR